MIASEFGNRDNLEHMSKTRVFVYGTLKRGYRQRGLDTADGSRFIGEAQTIKPYLMIDLVSFPGVILTGSKNATKISGEVFEISSSVLSQLDRIEGYPDFYTRTMVKTTLGDAWMYSLPAKEYSKYYDLSSKHISIVNGVASWNGQKHS
jgi:gamma-glutamylcyclotransferase (GGCT)/AIG2-like uncharacterized protein YtfP